MPFGSLSNVLEIKNAEGFRGSSVLQQSYPLTGYKVGAAPTPPAFTPLSLFASGEQGVWYDPSDLTTMFEDSAGTTPVHTPGNGTADSPVGKILDKSGRGNHATQSTSTARPTLSARYNGFTNTEDMNSLSKDNVTVTTDTTTAPDGTLTADSVYENPATSYHDLYFTGPSGYGSSPVFSVALKAGTRSWAWLYRNAGGVQATFFDLTNGVIGNSAAGNVATMTSLGNGWYRCSLVDATGFGLASANGSANYAGDPTKYIYAWGIDWRAAVDVANLPSYQRVGATGATYDITGFPYYLSFDGVNRFMQCDDTNMPTGDLSAYSGAKTFSGSGYIFNYGQGATGKAVFLYFSSNSPAWSQYGASVVSSFNTLNRVVIGGTRSGSSYVIRAQGGTYSNTGTMTSATAVQGTNGFGFGRGGAGTPSGYLQGRVYGAILCGRLNTAAEITNAETWMNTKTLAY